MKYPDSSTNDITDASILNEMSGKGLLMIDRTEYKIRQAFALKKLYGASTVGHCASLIVSFFVNMNVYGESVTVSLEVVKGPTQLINTINIKMGQYPGGHFYVDMWNSANNGDNTHFQMASSGSLMTRTYVWVSICQAPTGVYSRFKFAAGLDGTSLTQMGWSNGILAPTNTASDGNPMDLKLKATLSNSGINFRTYLRQIRIFEDGMDTTTIGIALEPNCLFQSAIFDSAGNTQLYCLQCSDPYVTSTSVPFCSPPVGTCAETNILGACSVCTNYYNIFAAYCFSSSPLSPCTTAIYGSLNYGNETLNYGICPILNYCPNQFKTRDEPNTYHCRDCSVYQCSSCKNSPCEVCNNNYFRVIQGSSITCISDTDLQNVNYRRSIFTNLVYWGKDLTDVAGNTYRPCKVQNCIDCRNDFTQCVKCQNYPSQTPDCALVCEPGCVACDSARTDPKACLPSACRTNYSFMAASSYCVDCTQTPGYSVVGGNCVACRPNCSSCTSPDGQTCASCMTNTSLDTTTNTCGDCRDGTYTDKTNSLAWVCKNCDQYCGTCDQTGFCLTCDTSSYFYSNRSCGLCKEDSMWINGGNCSNCDSTCLTCSNSTDTGCLTCDISRYLTTNNSCDLKQKIRVIKSEFAADMKQVIFTFDRPVKTSSGTIDSISEMKIFDNPSDQVVSVISTTSQSLSTITSLTQTVGCSIVSSTLKDTMLIVKIKADSSITDATLAVKFNQSPPLIQQTGPEAYLDTDYITQGKITMLVTGLDKGLESSKGAVSSAVSSASIVIFLVSVPQAFVLMKLFQTIDFYIYINCEYPSNFSKFLEILSQGIMDQMPNFFESWADEDGTDLYPRFEQFGLNIHVFSNLGRHFSLMTILGGIKLILWLLKIAFRNSKHAKRFSSNLT